MRIFHGPVPRGIYYDDIGPVDAGCYLETTRTECLRQLRMEACKMGGDIVYELPESPTRPEWREYHYKGLVAHTRPLKKEDIEEGRAPEGAKVGDASEKKVAPAESDGGTDAPGGDDASAASAGATGPVAPLGQVEPVTSTADGGRAP